MQIKYVCENFRNETQNQLTRQTLVTTIRRRLYRIRSDVITRHTPAEFPILAGIGITSG